MKTSVDLLYRRVFPVAMAVCCAAAAYGYPAGWPAWQILLVIGLTPLIVFTIWMYTGPLRRFRFLYGICGTLALVAACEAWEYGRIPQRLATSIDLPQPPGEPNLYFDYDLPAVEMELFPDAPDTLLLQAVQLNYCVAGGPPFQEHPYCRKYGTPDIQMIRRVLETAISKNPKTNEDLYFTYASVLVESGADQQQVDAAVDQWKRLFPLSERPDPRENGGRGLGKGVR